MRLSGESQIVFPHAGVGAFRPCVGKECLSRAKPEVSPAAAESLEIPTPGVFSNVSRLSHYRKSLQLKNVICTHVTALGTRMRLTE